MGISATSRRTFFLGLNSGYVEDGSPDRRMVEFYSARSSRALSCAIVGNVVIPGGHGSNLVSPHISRRPVWKELSTAISERGTLPGIQLATAWEGYDGARSFRSKTWSETIERSRALAETVTPTRLKEIFAALREGTEIAHEAGFTHVQLHAAHGYLFSLLVDERLYEGANDCLSLVTRWARASRELGLETSVRISLRTGDPEFDGRGAFDFQDRVSALPVDLVDVSSGFYNIDKRLIYPSVEPILSDRRAETLALARRHPNRRFILSGRAFRSADDLPTNVHLGLCRDLIANPNFLSDPGRGCINSGKCHYHSRGASNVTCPRWLEGGVADPREVT